MDVGLAWLAINAVQAEHTKATLAASAAGARLGNRHKLDHAGCLGRAALARAVDEFESSLIPVVQSHRPTGAAHARIHGHGAKPQRHEIGSWRQMAPVVRRRRGMIDVRR